MLQKTAQLTCWVNPSLKWNQSVTSFKLVFLLRELEFNKNSDPCQYFFIYAPSTSVRVYLFPQSRSLLPPKVSSMSCSTCILIVKQVRVVQFELCLSEYFTIKFGVMQSLWKSFLITGHSAFYQIFILSTYKSLYLDLNCVLMALRKVNPSFIATYLLLTDSGHPIFLQTLQTWDSILSDFYPKLFHRLPVHIFTTRSKNCKGFICKKHVSHPIQQLCIKIPFLIYLLSKLVFILHPGNLRASVSPFPSNCCDSRCFTQRMGIPSLSPVPWIGSSTLCSGSQSPRSCGLPANWEHWSHSFSQFWAWRTKSFEPGTSRANFKAPLWLPTSVLWAKLWAFGLEHIQIKCESNSHLQIIL